MSEHFNITKNSKVFIGCIPKLKTGGTELVHQLVSTINKLGGNAYILYCYGDIKTAENAAFKEYNCPFVMKIRNEDDNPNNILVVPETYTRLLYQYKNVQKAIWWMSVDFYYKNLTGGLNDFEIKFKNTIKRLLNMSDFQFGNDKNDYIHLCQSEYAYQFVKSKGCLKVTYLTDYINQSYFDLPKFIKKNDAVCYNPKKGIEFTNKIISVCKSRFGDKVKWIPLVNMTNEQVKQTLITSKVYIDFGEHPGKDRFPREAAVCGCCIITGKKGSAKFYNDVMIKDCYKFDESEIELVVDTIMNCCKNYDVCSKDFIPYIAKIKLEKQQFLDETKYLFFGE